MKKVMAIMLISLILISLISTISPVVSADTEGLWTYQVSEGKATITACSSPMGVLEIPDTLGGYPVTEIGGNVFKDCAELISVAIPEGVTIIGGSAFYGCSALTSVDLPASL